jgi:CRISPR/Cas system CSM-associated protein Csm3 (group 7 of RAMP superfamily)
MDLDLFKGSSFKGKPGQAGPDPDVKNYFFIYGHEHPQIDLLQYGSSRGPKYYGKLFISITTLQDIFIGSGKIDKSGRQLVDGFSYVMTGSGNKTWNIPGSSIKGCIFTHLTILLKNRSTDFFSAKEGPARIFFSDLPMASGSEATCKEIPARFSPREVPEGVMVKLYKKEYQKDTLPQGSQYREPGKERIQAIRIGSRFEGHLHFKELDEFEITMLVLALGGMPGNRFNFKIGGAKNRAMGLVKLQIDFGKSFYTRTLKEIAVKNVLPFAGLKPNLERTVSQLKQDFPALDILLKKLQGEYGQ